MLLGTGNNGAYPPVNPLPSFLRRDVLMGTEPFEQKDSFPGILF